MVWVMVRVGVVVGVRASVVLWSWPVGLGLGSELG